MNNQKSTECLLSPQEIHVLVFFRACFKPFLSQQETEIRVLQKYQNNFIFQLQNESFIDRFQFYFCSEDDQETETVYKKIR